MATRKRITPLIKNVGGGGGGGPSPGGTINWGPSFGQSLGDDESTFNVNAAVNLDSLALIGGTTATATVTMPAIALEGSTSATAALTMPELGLSGGATASASLVGTAFVEDLLPDADTYLDRDNPTTAFGSSTTLLAKLNTAIVNDDKNTYIAWDFTKFAGSASVSQDASLTFYASENAIGASSLSYQIYTHTSAPFVEATATWDNTEQPPGTLQSSGTESIDGATLAAYTITIPAADLDAAIGNWFYVRFTGNASSALVTFTIGSKENAGNEPSLTFTLDLT